MEILPSHSSSRSLAHRSNRALYHFSSLSLSLDLWQSWVFSPFESVPGKRANVKLAASAFPRVVFLPKVSKRQPLILWGGGRFYSFSHNFLTILWMSCGKVDWKRLFFENKHAFNQTLIFHGDKVGAKVQNMAFLIVRFQMNSPIAFWLALLFAVFDGLPRSLSEFSNTDRPGQSWVYSLSNLGERFEKCVILLVSFYDSVPYI